MTELLIIKTANVGKIKTLLTKNKVDYQVGLITYPRTDSTRINQVIYNEIVQDKELTQAEFEKQLENDYKAWANDPDEGKDANGE